MQLLNAFNPAAVVPRQGGGGGLPIGKHPVTAVASAIKATNANDGGYVEYTLRISDGPLQGATGPWRIALYTSKEKGRAYAEGVFSAFCHAVGLAATQITDSDQLLNLPFMIEVGPQDNNPEYTEVKTVLDINGNEPGKAPQNQQAQQQGAAQGGFGGQQQAAGGFGGQQQGQGGGAAQGGFGGGQQQGAGQGAWGQPQGQQGAAQGGFGGQQQAAGGFGGQQQGQGGGAAPWGQQQ